MRVKSINMILILGLLFAVHVSAQESSFSKDLVSRVIKSAQSDEILQKREGLLHALHECIGYNSSKSVIDEVKQNHKDAEIKSKAWSDIEAYCAHYIVEGYNLGLSEDTLVSEVQKHAAKITYYISYFREVKKANEKTE